MIVTDMVHLMSDTMDVAELHAFAKRIGLRRHWFQNHPVHPHYDLLTPRMREKAVTAGAKIMTSVELVSTYWRRPAPEINQPECAETV
jgi:hypothetical protein